jgi:teichuronic acid biosynthesis glycosyltransferase TuaH
VARPRPGPAAHPLRHRRRPYLGTDRAPLPPGVHLPAPVAGFIGRLNARSDLGLLEAIAARGRPAARPNVHWAGQQPAAALPGYLRLMDVGPVPYTPSWFNRGSFPLKVLEYLDAGRPVAATDLPALRALGTDLIHITTPASSADQVDHLLTQPRTRTWPPAARPSPPSTPGPSKPPTSTTH